MKLSSLFVAGTIASSVLLAGVHVDGQSVDDLGGKPTRLPLVGLDTVGEDVVGHAINSQAVSHPAIQRPAVTPSSVPPQPWLQSTTAMASSAKASQKLEQAKVEFHSKAWLSAEQSAWESISLFSQAIDLRGNVNDAGDRFRVAKDAIVEARDFGGPNATTDPDSILRLAKSHRTNVITTDDISTLTSAVAADRYLDFARRNLASLASQDVRCAEAIDFLAAIYLGRDEATQLPGETALCLRRAALQGQPANADLAARLGMQLADVGLVDEAKWALEHSLQIQFQPVIANRLAALLQHTGQDAVANQWREQVAVRSRFREGAAGDSSLPASAVASQASSMNADSPIAMPMITQLSPREFASVSKPVMQETSLASVVSTPRPKAVVPVSFASASLDELNQSLHAKPSPPSAEAEAETQKTNPVRRWIQSIKKPWVSTSR